MKIYNVNLIHYENESTKYSFATKELAEETINKLNKQLTIIEDNKNLKFVLRESEVLDKPVDVPEVKRLFVSVDKYDEDSMLVVNVEDTIINIFFDTRVPDEDDVKSMTVNITRFSGDDINSINVELYVPIFSYDNPKSIEDRAKTAVQDILDKVAKELLPKVDIWTIWPGDICDAAEGWTPDPSDNEWFDGCCKKYPSPFYN